MVAKKVIEVEPEVILETILQEIGEASIEANKPVGLLEETI